MQEDYGLLSPEYYYEYIWLLDKKGEVVVAEHEETACRRKYFLFGKRIPIARTRQVRGLVSANNTIEDTLHALGEKADAVRFILSYFELTETAIVYKAPKDVSVLDWVRQQIEKEKKLILATCAEIDAEAVAS